MRDYKFLDIFFSPYANLNEKLKSDLMMQKEFPYKMYQKKNFFFVYKFL